MKIRSSKNIRKYKYGGYAVAITILVIAAVVAVNVGMVQLTQRLGWEFDLTRNNRYTLGSASRKVARDLTHDIVIYPMFSDSLAESYPEYTRLFENLAAESDRISIQYVDPATNPQFANRYLDSTMTYISAGSVIVARSDDSKYRVLTGNDFYQYSYDTTNYTRTATAFIGEQAMSNALLYVDSDTSPKVYWLTGHEEEGVSAYSAVTTYLERENYECADIDSTMIASLEPGDVLVISAPTRDLTSEELQALGAFAENGGRLIYLAPQGINLPNFEELLGRYGVSVHPNLVYETDASHWYSAPYLLVPNVEIHNVTSVVRENDLTVYMPYGQWLEVSTVRNNTLTVTPLLTTSDTAYAKVDPNATTLEKEDGDIDGPFNLALAIEQTDANGESANDVRIAVFSSSTFATQLSIYGGNTDLFLQAVRWMQNEDTNVVSIVGKSLSEDRLSIRTQSQQLLACGIVAIGIPLVVLISGVVVWLRRRHL